MVPARRFVARSTAVALLALIVLLPSPASAGPYQDGNRAIALTNDVRAAYGVQPVVWDAYLQMLADEWVAELAAGNYLAHNSALPGRMRWYGVWGENVGWGSSVGEVHDGFYNSWSHYENMVDSRFTSIGVGIGYGWDGALFVVQVFGG